MENEEIIKKLEEQDQKLDSIYRSVEKTRKYFLWTLIITVMTIILPLIAIAFIIPRFLQILSSTVNLQ